MFQVYKRRLAPEHHIMHHGCVKSYYYVSRIVPTHWALYDVPFPFLFFYTSSRYLCTSLARRGISPGSSLARSNMKPTVVRSTAQTRD
jgi:hypothetical protein